MRLNLAMLLFCGSFWGLSFTLSRIVMGGGGHPLAVTFWHSAAMAALIWAILAALGRLPRIDRAFLRFVPVLGVLGGAAPSFLLFGEKNPVLPTKQVRTGSWSCPSCCSSATSTPCCQREGRHLLAWQPSGLYSSEIARFWTVFLLGCVCQKSMLRGMSHKNGSKWSPK